MNRGRVVNQIKAALRRHEACSRNIRPPVQLRDSVENNVLKNPGTESKLGGRIVGKDITITGCPIGIGAADHGAVLIYRTNILPDRAGAGNTILNDRAVDTQRARASDRSTREAGSGGYSSYR